MRIVAHNAATIWGGAERATVKLLGGLAQRGHDVRLLCNAGIVAENARRLGVESEILVIAGDLALHHTLRLRRRLLELAPDAFIVGTFKKLFIAALGAKMAGVRKVVARIGLESDTPRSWKYRVALRRWTDAVVVNSATIARSFVLLDGFESDRVRVIHNGVEPLSARKSRDVARADLGIQPGSFLIGTVARLAIQKRIDRLVEAVSLLPENVQCVVAGEGTRKAEIEAVINERGVSSRVRLLGHRNDVGDFLSALDAYVVSSDSEGLSNAMLEAMSLGKPVVSTAVSGAEDALGARSRDDAAGLIVDRTPDAIASAIRELMDHPRLAAQLGATAAHRAANEFSVERMLDEWESFLRGA
jgi:glycosyltransferase involved in cell wall biosynthesis